MLRNPERLGQVTSAVVKAVPQTPVTVKIEQGGMMTILWRKKWVGLRREGRKLLSMVAQKNKDIVVTLTGLS